MARCSAPETSAIISLFNFLVSHFPLCNIVCPPYEMVLKDGICQLVLNWHKLVILRAAATYNMTPCSILCILVMWLKRLNRSQHNIDSTQPRGWYVPITLRMQRPHHLLGGGEYCYESAQLYLTVCTKHTAPSSTRIMCWGSPLYQRLIAKYFTPFPLNL